MSDAAGVDDPLARYRTILAERQLYPFAREAHDFGPRVLGTMLPFRWRVAPDEWERLELWAGRQWGWSSLSAPEPRLFGWPIERDPQLPDGAVVLEATGL